MKMELPARAWSAADNITWPEQEQPRDCSVKEEHRPAGNLYTGGTGFGYLRQQHQPSSCLPRPPTMAQRINRKLQQKCRFFPHFTVPYFKHKVCFHQMVFRRHELLPDLQPTQIPLRQQLVSSAMVPPCPPGGPAALAAREEWTQYTTRAGASGPQLGHWHCSGFLQAPHPRLGHIHKWFYF